MLKDIVEEWKRKGGECETVTIDCPFCHQGMVAEVTPDLIRNKELLKELAVETCSCPQAKQKTNYKKRTENIDSKVDRMFGEESGTPVDEEIRTQLKALSLYVCHGKIKKAGIQSSDNVKVTVSTDSNGLLDIKKEIKNISRQKI